MALNKSIIGQQLLNFGTVHIASNNPKNVFLLILNTEDKNIDVSVLYDRRFDVLIVSKNFRENNEEEEIDDRNIEITNEEKQQIINFIESYEITNE